MIDELKEQIAKQVEQQGNQVNGSELAQILRKFLELTAAAGALTISATAETTINGFKVPKLTADQVIQAYNAVATGRGCIIEDPQSGYHNFVIQADTIGADLVINILYFSTMLITYELEGDHVNISYKMIDGQPG